MNVTVYLQCEGPGCEPGGLPSPPAVPPECWDTGRCDSGSCDTKKSLKQPAKLFLQTCDLTSLNHSYFSYTCSPQLTTVRLVTVQTPRSFENAVFPNHFYIFGASSYKYMKQMKKARHKNLSLSLPVAYFLNLLANLFTPIGYQEHKPLGQLSLENKQEWLTSALMDRRTTGLKLPFLSPGMLFCAMFLLNFAR